MKKEVCFVIMGFGKKSDPSTGKTLDLDKTYKNIIRPVVTECGYECIRADEIQESGIIDRSMYALLLQAPLVIADISTYNPNAIYELGIRHALRPYSTIVLKESEGKIPFDLDHTRMFTYSHLGEDIGVDEAERCKTQLKALIMNVTKLQQVDSPLYEYIGTLVPPNLPPEEYELIIKEFADREKFLFAITEKATSAMEKSNFSLAAAEWGRANKIAPNEPYFIQQRALCTYKSKKPAEEIALIDALQIIQVLEPEGSTNDPETLGITGAIYKNLFLVTKHLEYLTRAIKFYGKCYKIRNDYYTGENYALCLNLKAINETDEEQKIYCRIEAENVRRDIVSFLKAEEADASFLKRADKKWVYATLSQCLFALDMEEGASYYQDLFAGENPLSWEAETFQKAREQLKTVKS